MQAMHAFQKQCQIYGWWILFMLKNNKLCSTLCWMICQLLALKQWTIKQPRFSFCDNWNNEGQGIIMYLKPLHLFATKSVMALP